MTTTYEPNVVLSQVEYDVVGTRPIRHDGADKVTGRAKYGADVHTTGMLYGYILRSHMPTQTYGRSRQARRRRTRPFALL